LSRIFTPGRNRNSAPFKSQNKSQEQLKRYESVDTSTLKTGLVRRNSVDNKAHEEAEQDKLASILAFQPETKHQQLKSKTLVLPSYDEDNETESLKGPQVFQQVSNHSKPEGHSSTDLANSSFHQTPIEGASSKMVSNNFKRKVDEKPPSVAHMMKKVKSESKLEATDWQKEYEERKKLRLATFKP